MKYNLSEAESTLKLADELRKFIQEKKLWLDVHGKPHINIEAWQYAAANLGIVPVVERVENLSTESEIKYGAFVTCYQMESWAKVSAGYAVCSNKEPGKRNNPEFAICSMAQTRAEGKAYRLLLGWLIKAAGYEATPSEEMDSLGIQEPEQKQAANNKQVQQNTQKQAENPAIAKATKEQKDKIAALLNNPVIKTEERVKGVNRIPKLTIESAEVAIKYYTKMVNERTQQPA